MREVNKQKPVRHTASHAQLVSGSNIAALLDRVTPVLAISSSNWAGRSVWNLISPKSFGNPRDAREQHRQRQLIDDPSPRAASKRGICGHFRAKILRRADGQEFGEMAACTIDTAFDGTDGATGNGGGFFV